MHAVNVMVYVLCEVIIVLSIFIIISMDRRWDKKDYEARCASLCE